MRVAAGALARASTGSSWSQCAATHALARRPGRARPPLHTRLRRPRQAPRPRAVGARAARTELRPARAAATPQASWHRAWTARLTGSCAVLGHLARSIAGIRQLRFLLALIGWRRRWHLPLGGIGLLRRRRSRAGFGGGHACASTRPASRGRIHARRAPVVGAPRPTPGRPPSSARPSAEYQYRCPCGTAGQNPGDWPAPWRPATDALCTPALTARRAAHPAPAVPVRLLCAPTAPGKGRAPKTALMSTRLPPRAAGAHQSRRSLTRCRRWVCSGATASTSANPRARRAAGPPVPLRPARSYALSHGREGILSTNFLIQTANLFRTVVTVTTCRIFLFFSGGPLTF